MKSMKPQFIPYDHLEDIRGQHPELAVDDKPDLAVSELFDIQYPQKKDTKTDEEVADFSARLTGGKPDSWGEWVYYPWLNRLVHFPPKTELRSLRTSRNRNLIDTQQQAELYGATLLVVGMSVGSNIVEALVSMGIGEKLILVDMDIIEPSNLNRIRSPYHHVGLHKVDAIARKVWELDPYIEIVMVKDGLNEQNLKTILEEQRPAVIIDEIDSLRMKVVLREEAKKAKLPVVMAADDGDNSLLDIERYDLKPDLALFSGRIPPEFIDKIKADDLSRVEIGNMIGKYFVGVDNIPLRMFQSLMEIGKSLPSWPQLGGAAALSGLAVAYAVRKIVLGEKINDGRILIAIDEKIDRERLEPGHQEELAKFKKAMGG